MKIFNKYLTLILGLALSLNSFAGNDLSMFKPNVQPLVEKFINNEKPKEKDLVDLLNKEFGKDIVLIVDFEGKGYIEKNKHIELSEKELLKLKDITKFLTDETINKKGVGSTFVGIIEMEFDY